MNSNFTYAQPVDVNGILIPSIFLEILGIGLLALFTTLILILVFYSKDILMDLRK